jgi:hypothetical protein
MSTAGPIERRASHPQTKAPRSGQADTANSLFLAAKDDLEIINEVMRRHKAMTKTFVIPGMSVIGIAWWFAAMQHTPFHYALLASGIAVAGLNAWMTSSTSGVLMRWTPRGGS